jgi:hypothetical protein
MYGVLYLEVVLLQEGDVGTNGGLRLVCRACLRDVQIAQAVAAGADAQLLDKLLKDLHHLRGSTKRADKTSGRESKGEMGKLLVQNKVHH